MRYFLVVLSCAVGVLLSILPLPHWAIWLRPQFMLLIVLYWVLMMPSHYGVIFAWIVGLATDLIVGAPLCEHALSFTIVVFFALKFYQVIFHAPLFQQSFYIGILAVLTVFLQNIVLHFNNDIVYVGLSLLSVLTTMVIWFWLSPLRWNWRMS